MKKGGRGMTVNYRQIELARQFRGYTQMQLAKKINIAQSDISKIEKGIFNCSEATLDKIAEALNFPKRFFYQQELQTPISHHYYKRYMKIKV